MLKPSSINKYYLSFRGLKIESVKHGGFETDDWSDEAEEVYNSSSPAGMNPASSALCRGRFTTAYAAQRI